MCSLCKWGMVQCRYGSCYSTDKLCVHVLFSLDVCKICIFKWWYSNNNDHNKTEPQLQTDMFKVWMAFSSFFFNFWHNFFFLTFKHPKPPQTIFPFTIFFECLLKCLQRYYVELNTNVRNDVNKYKNITLTNFKLQITNFKFQIERIFR